MNFIVQYSSYKTNAHDAHPVEYSSTQQLTRCSTEYSNTKKLYLPSPNQSRCSVYSVIL